MSLSEHAVELHGQLTLSNNGAERVMRSLALGCKIWMSCRFDAGGQRADCVYTIVETAKMHNLNPCAYLADVMGRIAEHASRQLDALLPWNWTL